MGRCAGGGVYPVVGVGDLPEPAGLVSGLCASGWRGWLVDRAAAAAGASGGQADLCRDGAAGVAAGRGAGQCRAGVADRAGADPPVGAGPGPGLPLSRVRGAGASGGSSRGPLGRRRPDGSGRTWSRCARSITTRTTAASSRSPGTRTCRAGWCSWPGAGSRSGRARSTPRHHPRGGRPRVGGAGSRSAVVGAAAWTIGVSTEGPDGPDPLQRAEQSRGPRLPRRGRRARAGRSGRAVARGRTAGGLPGRDRGEAAQQVGHLPRRPSPPALTRAP